MTPENTPERQYRVHLAPLKEYDLEFVRTLRNKFKDSFVSQNEVSPEQQVQWYQNVYLGRKREDYTLFVVRTCVGEPIGTTSFSKTSADSYEIGNNIIDTPFQGKGYFTEVYHQVKKLVGGKMIIATVLTTNTHMLDVYKKLGFTSRNDATNKHLSEKDGIVTLTDQ